MNRSENIKLLKIPILISKYGCGQGTPFTDGIEYMEVPDVSVEGVKKPYVVVATGDSMAPYIIEDDLLVVDYKSAINNKDIVVANINGEMLVKVYFINNFSTYLVSYNERYKPIKINDWDNFEVLGKVVNIIRQTKILPKPQNLK